MDKIFRQLCLKHLRGCVEVYRCMRFQKFTRLLLCDTIIIIIAFAITFASQNCFSSNVEEDIFLPVIMYHSIVDDTSKISDYTVTPEIVENDLKFIKEKGFNTVTTEDVINYVNGGELPENPIIITADDGFYNNKEYLLPLLEKYDMKAVISVVGYYSEVIAEMDPHVPEYSYLTWNDISELKKSRRIEIANHTYNMHSYKERKGCAKFSYENEDEYADELIGDIGLCQTLLTINCSLTPAVFTYPFGSISEESIPVLKSMGFCAAYSCYERPNYINRSSNCLFTLDRYNRSGLLTTEEFMKRALSDNRSSDVEKVTSLL